MTTLFSHYEFDIKDLKKASKAATKGFVYSYVIPKNTNDLFDSYSEIHTNANKQLINGFIGYFSDKRTEILEESIVGTSEAYKSLLDKGYI